jgi:hypothetical protein
MTKIIKKEDDPLALRASIGGRPDIGFYCTFRGNLSDIVEMLEKVLTDLKNENIR